MKISARTLSIALSATLIGACSSTGVQDNDPYEGYNRAMFSFNEKVDKYALKPVAQGYNAVTPPPVRSWAGSFLSNLGDVWIGANNLMQGKATQGFSDWGRFLTNSTLGLFGFFDVATDFGLPKHDEDFGQTLGKWGVGEGGYVMLPLLGPRTLRDTGGLVVDWSLGSVLKIKDAATRNSIMGLSIVDARARLLGTEKTLEEATLDKYAYVRDFYLQQRRYKVTDGKMRAAREEDDWYEEEPPAGAPALPNPSPSTAAPPVLNLKLFKE